jgi:hypothetical protein
MALVRQARPKASFLCRKSPPTCARGMSRMTTSEWSSPLWFFFRTIWFEPYNKAGARERASMSCQWWVAPLLPFRGWNGWLIDWVDEKLKEGDSAGAGCQTGEHLMLPTAHPPTAQTLDYLASSGKPASNWERLTVLEGSHANVVYWYLVSRQCTNGKWLPGALIRFVGCPLLVTCSLMLRRLILERERENAAAMVAARLLFIFLRNWKKNLTTKKANRISRSQRWVGKLALLPVNSSLAHTNFAERTFAYPRFRFRSKHKKFSPFSFHA